MAEKPPARVAFLRGQRVKALRKRQLGLNGDQFAVRMTEVGRELGLQVVYDKTKVSKTENGNRDLSPEDLAILEVIDPQHRSWKFWAFGWEVADYEQLIDPQRDRKLTEQEEQRALRAADAKRAGKAAKKGRRASPGSA